MKTTCTIVITDNDDNTVRTEIAFSPAVDLKKPDTHSMAVQIGMAIAKSLSKNSSHPVLGIQDNGGSFIWADACKKPSINTAPADLTEEENEWMCRNMDENHPFFQEYSEKWIKEIIELGKKKMEQIIKSTGHPGLPGNASRN